MSNKIDPLALFLESKPKRATKSISLTDISKIKDDVVKNLDKKEEKIYACQTQIDYLRRFEEKGLGSIHAFIKEEYRTKIKETSGQIKKEFEKRGTPENKMNRHIIFNIIMDYYFLNNPDFEKSIKDAIFGIDEQD